LSVEEFSSGIVAIPFLPYWRFSKVTDRVVV